MRLHAFISGQVQGVFFRQHAKMKAESLGLTGFVKNLPDGRVEVIAEGSERELKEFLEWLHKGSPNANVKGVSNDFVEATGEFSEFIVSF